MLAALLLIGAIAWSGCRLRSLGAISLRPMTRTDEEPLIEVVQAIRLRSGCHGTVAVKLGRLCLLRLLLRVLLLVLVKFFGHFINETLVVLGVLQVAFRQDAVSGGSRIPRQSHIFFIDLISRAANAHIRAVTVESLNAGINPSAALLAAIVMVMTTTAVTATIVATATITAATRTSCVLIMSHAVFSSLRLTDAPIPSLRELYLFLS